MKGRLDALWVALGGVLTGLAVILPDYFGVLEWVSLVPVFIVLMKNSDRVMVPLSRYYGLGFLFYLSYGMTYFHWFIAMYPLDFTGLGNLESIIVVVLAWIGLSALYALLGGVFFLIYGVFAKLDAFRHASVLKVALLPILFVLYEFTLTLDWWGVPWGKLALGQTYFLPMLQSASLFGSYFICALLVFANASLAFLFVHEGKKLTRVLPTVLALLLLVANIVGGLYIYKRAPVYENGKETTTFAALQGNTPSQLPLTDKETFHIYLDLSIEAANQGADVILWPESSIAGAIYEDNYYGIYASSYARAYDVYLIIGSTTYKDEKEYNSMTFIDPDGNFAENTYDKRRLVPFGEFVPYRAFFETFIPPLVEVTMLDRDNTPGDSAEIYTRDGIGSLGGLICFESIFERLALESVREGAEVFVVGTNDSWFRTSLATSMHRAHEQLRSIECGRYSVRSSTTGITCIINSRGEVIDALPMYEEGYLIAEVPLLNHTTLSAPLGDIIIPVFILTLLALFSYTLIRRKKDYS